MVESEHTKEIDCQDQTPIVSIIHIAYLLGITIRYAGPQFG